MTVTSTPNVICTFAHHPQIIRIYHGPKSTRRASHDHRYLRGSRTIGYQKSNPCKNTYDTGDGDQSRDLG